MYEHLSLLIWVTKQISTINAHEALLCGEGRGVIYVPNLNYKYVHFDF